jgi:predicted RNA-binding protein
MLKMSTRDKRYWIGVASREHVKTGVAGGFSQLCHGKAQPLKRMAVGDGLIYYSAKEKFGENRLCQQFTAIGEVIGSEVYQFEMFPGFVPYRQDIRFFEAGDVAIRPLIERLSFIKDKMHWGYAFRYGHLEIPRADFELIAAEMLL